MVNKKPPFKINEKIMTEVIDIAESVGEVSISGQISANPTLRRTNRIRTIIKFSVFIILFALTFFNVMI